MNTLKEKGTWTEVVNPSENIKTLPSHLVLKIKRNKHGQAKKFKARVVAGGNRQKYMEDYEKIYAPVVDFAICLLVLLICFVMQWFTRHVDVKASFLNGNIDRILHIRHPYNLPNANRRKIYLLHKSLYGLKQAPLLWYSKLREALVRHMVFTQLQSEYCVFIKWHQNGVISIILAYVDDLIFISSVESILRLEINTFLSHFEGTEGPLEWYLGVSIHMDGNKFTISQSAYIQQSLNVFGLQNCRTYTTPMISNFFDELMHNSNDEADDTVQYRNMIGRLQFLARRSRPDIMLAVNVLAQYSANPTKYHTKFVKRIFGYLKYTQDFALQYDRSEKLADILIFHADYDFGGERSTR